MTTARYDGLAQWYEAFRPSLSHAESEIVRRLAGPGPGRCIEVGCGTGLVGTLVRGRARLLVGIDISAPMLAHANGKKAYDELHNVDLPLSTAQ